MKQKTLKMKEETNIFTIRVENFSTPFLINDRIKRKVRKIQKTRTTQGTNLI